MTVVTPYVVADNKRRDRSRHRRKTQEAVRVQRKLSLAVVGALGFALALTACGDDSNDSGDDGGDSGGDSGAGKIGVILPDTESSVRWESQDRPNLEAAFEE